MDLKDRLVTAALPHVPFDGWSAKTLRQAALETGIALEIAQLTFPDPAYDMINAYVRMADAQMLDRLPEGFDDMKVREKVTACVRSRLEIAGEHEEATRRAVRVYAQPHYASRAARSTWKTADAIWIACGDTATDYNHYTKRAILSGVYNATLLYWLQDDSADKADSWAFLDRRISGVMRFEKVKARAVQGIDRLPLPQRLKDILMGEAA